MLNRPKFRFDPEKVRVVIEGLLRRGVFVNAEVPDIVLPDPKDAVFYEIVMEKRKSDEAFLVTGNIKHFPSKSYVVTPREMLTILGKE